jgi:hypothetical protein
MAKLTARGRTVVHSVTREYDAETLQRAHDRMYPEGPFSGQKALCIWKRRTERLMSDRSILEKIDVQFQPKQGRRHAGTWRLKGKLKAGVTPAAWLYAGFCLCGWRRANAEGYRCESCGEPAVSGAENVLLSIVP